MHALGASTQAIHQRNAFLCIPGYSQLSPQLGMSVICIDLSRLPFSSFICNGLDTPPTFGFIQLSRTLELCRALLVAKEVFFIDALDDVVLNGASATGGTWGQMETAESAQLRVDDFLELQDTVVVFAQFRERHAVVDLPTLRNVSI